MQNQRIEFLKKLLPGFIPLFAFIAVDEIWGTKAGVIAALIIGIIEMTWIRVKEKRFDRFVLFDTLLLIALGGISILLDNDIFFKLKPALIELILCAVIALSAFSKVNIVELMSRRYMKGMEISEVQMSKMRQSLKLMFFVFLAHTALVFYAVFYMSNEAWAFISGGLFYILFGVVFIIEFAKQKRKQKQLSTEEQLPIVNEQGKVLGKAPRSVCHNGEKLLHPVVHLHVLNRKGDIYLQKRPLDKLVQPGKWDTAVGGHISFGEDLQTALRREAWEEIGLKEFSAKLVKQYIWESDLERELVYVFVTNDFQGIHLHSDEVTEGRFWTKKQLENSLGNSIFTPNFEHEFKLFFC
ncbi:NUDIX domain-containing protein [uncultured Sunxiuqinia sp.]|uniref:NUDIX domain-containing protein n=1 Tax=uncultured Sunxiuqinia sp. TaxID=1573825 RepID=UPI002AA7AD0F|nr:NUDIX domain-containing protein [uncultured Sunxiuqinia sp.]